MSATIRTTRIPLQQATTLRYCTQVSTLQVTCCNTTNSRVLFTRSTIESFTVTPLSNTVFVVKLQISVVSKVTVIMCNSSDLFSENLRVNELQTKYAAYYREFYPTQPAWSRVEDFSLWVGYIPVLCDWASSVSCTWHCHLLAGFHWSKFRLTPQVLDRLFGTPFGVRKAPSVTNRITLTAGPDIARYPCSC